MIEPGSTSGAVQSLSCRCSGNADFMELECEALIYVPEDDDRTFGTNSIAGCSNETTTDRVEDLWQA
jgi:hypothetical protein